MGRVIWLPEISQEEINLLCLSMFIAIDRGGLHSKDDAMREVIASATRLYRAFDRRSKPIEHLLGGGAMGALMPAENLSTPAQVASLFLIVQRTAKLSSKDLAARIDGMRLLPYPKPFTRYIDWVSEATNHDFPVHGWGASVRKALEARDEQARVEGEAAALFDGGSAFAGI